MLDTFFDYIIIPLFNNYSSKIYWVFSKLYFDIIFLILLAVLTFLILKIFKKNIFRIIFLSVLFIGIIIFIIIPFIRGTNLNDLRHAGYETISLLEDYKEKYGTYPDSLKQLNEINEKKFIEINYKIPRIDYTKSNYDGFYLTIHNDILGSEWWYYDSYCKCFKATNS